MRRNDVPPPPRRSAAGFALALALAAASVWLAGLVIELAPLVPATARAHVALAAATDCASAKADAQCGSARSPDDRR